MTEALGLSQSTNLAQLTSTSNFKTVQDNKTYINPRLILDGRFLETVRDRKLASRIVVHDVDARTKFD